MKTAGCFACAIGAEHKSCLTEDVIAAELEQSYKRERRTQPRRITVTGYNIEATLVAYINGV